MTWSDEVPYKGFAISSRCLPLKAGGWTIEARIRRNSVIKSYSASNTFQTEKEAIAHSIEFGRHIVDGEIPEF